ncbi:MAG: hypothetical protein J5999_03405 [Oscillospiraceae bacterium]|nr:hypothetical protein [Oscillospiraceae bacterium]
MKKRLAAILSLALLLTACGVSGDTVDTAAATEAVTPEVTSAETTTAETTTAETTATETTAQQETTVSEAETEVPQSIDLSDHINAFDDADPLQYSVYDPLYSYEYEVPQSAEKAALDAVLSSEYVKIVTEEAKKMFDYSDGVYTYIGEEFSFLSDTYLEYLGENYQVEPRLVMTRNAKFDGENTEYIFIYAIPLHYDFLEWSGTTEFFIPVYVNSSGEAFLLEAAAQQTLYRPDLLYYSDGVIHAAFTSGHTAGTSYFAIYSFKDGKPKLETEGCGLSFDSPYGTLLFNDHSGFFGHGNLFFRDGQRDCYCGVAGVPASDELKNILMENGCISDENEACEVFGGRYISFDMGSKKVENGSFTDSEYGSIYTGEEYCDYRYWLNIDLN